jgi:outer membrane receptor protein involved in Fe transport
MLAGLAHPVAAQDVGRIEGTVTRQDDGSPLGGVSVTVVGTGVSTVTGTDGAYTLPRVPEGPRQILFRWLGFQAQEMSLTVRADATQTGDVALVPQVISLGEIIVSGASRTPERVVEAPAAISVVNPITLRDASLTGQAPQALTSVAGVDVVQSGVNDYNVNARGFNSSLNRRVLVLQDGRDLAIAFLGSQEWNALSISLEELGRLEMVRGPGSALYGANAFAGVLSIRTPPARDVVGTKISLGGGELTTFRGDLRHAGVSPDGRFGYRFNVGYNRSNTRAKSRTRVDGLDAQNEYGQVTDDPVVTGLPTCGATRNCLAIEGRALNGQTRDPTNGLATGDIDNVQNIYGSGRFDYYADNGSIFTVEGGAAQVENDIFVTGIGRVQVTKALRPWARIGWDSDNYNLMAWYSGRNSIEPQYSLASGVELEESSALLHVEGQYNRSFAEDRARIVVGASARSSNVDTETTLMAPGDDDRSDAYFSGYGQFEFKVAPQVRLVAAARVDDGDLIDTQFSPKGAIVFSPNDQHSIRFTVNRAFQTPNYSEFFLRANTPAHGLTSPAELEAGLEQLFAVLQNPGAPPAGVGPALSALMGTLGLPSDVPWNFSAQTPGLALGNDSLDVEKVTSWEVGYKGNVSDRAYVSVDLYLSKISDFVTDLLPANILPDANTKYTQYSFTADGTDIPANLDAIEGALDLAMIPAAHPLRASLAQLRGGYGQLTGALGSQIATLPDGTRAFIVSYANAGEVTEQGIELGFGYGFTPEVRIDGTYTFFDFDVDEEQFGQDIIPNTPKHKGTVGLTYSGLQGFDFGVKARFVDGYEWVAGVFAGDIPSTQTVDVNAGYAINNNLRLYAIATNFFDQTQFHLYGGSLVRRRVLGGLTATF